MTIEIEARWKVKLGLIWDGVLDGSFLALGLGEDGLPIFAAETGNLLRTADVPGMVVEVRRYGPGHILAICQVDTAPGKWVGKLRVVRLADAAIVASLDFAFPVFLLDAVPGAVLLGTLNGEAHGLMLVDPSTGTTVWSKPTSTRVPAGQILPDRCLINVENQLIAMARTTGNPIKTKDLGSPAVALMMNDQILLVGLHDKATGSSFIMRLDRTSWSPVWKFSTAGEVEHILPTDTVAFVTMVKDIPGGDEEASVAAYRLQDGNAEWRVPFGNRRMGRPFLHHRRLFVPMVQRGPNDLPGGGLLCLDAETGREIYRGFTRNWFKGIRAFAVDDVAILATHEYLAGFDIYRHWQHDAGSGILAAPSITWEPTIVVGAIDGTITALHFNSGVQQWKTAFGGGPIETPPIQVDDLIVFASGALVLALRVTTGEEIWRFLALDRVRGTMAAENGRLAFGGRDGFVRLLTAATGEEVMSVQLDGAVEGGVTMAAGFIYAGTTNGTFYALKEDGTVSWQQAGVDEINARPALFSDSVVVADAGGGVHCYQALASNGLKRWDHQLDGPGGFSAPYVDGSDNVLIGDELGHAYAIDGRTGERLWRSPRLDPIQASLTIHENEVVVATMAGRVAWLDRRTGDLCRSVAGFAPIFASPVSQHGILCIADQQGSVVRLLA